MAGPTLRDAVVKGQIQASKAIKIEFGGPNQRLIDKLVRDTAADLGKASQSPKQFLSNALRRAEAYAVEREFETNRLVDINGKVSASLLRSSLDTSHMRQGSYEKTVKSMLDDLGLDAEDRVLFLSGYRMSAEAYAETLVRSRTMEALNQAKAEELMDNGYLYIETSEHEGVDERDICYFLQGKVWALAENDLGIPLLPEEYGLPPWHPNCAHTFGAWQPKFESEKTISKAIDSHEGDEEALAEWDGKSAKPAAKGED